MKLGGKYVSIPNEVLTDVDMKELAVALGKALEQDREIKLLRERESEKQLVRKFFQ